MIDDIEQETVREVDQTLDLPAETALVEVIEAEDSSRAMRAGDRVRVTPLGLVGNLIDDVDGREKVAVQVGSLRLMVEPESLRLLQPERKSARPIVRTRVMAGSGVDAASAVSQQLNLLGQRADEAAESLDRYLYDANAAGLDRVRIVHGKGTGALRRVVQEQLKANPLVEGYAMADAEEGGAGATIANLKSR